ncbi:DUF1304 domain-containing protein [Streptococcus didelphis]|uniref:DUF1304 domain-containing protein n=1 Tax=Streptococcus didelphis TaxID=102886 RepID=A0ABY9LFF1_9STRE|nr:DUF1304 domain-containing protein [Streptococcus didelphis]WMB27651.1 DUF1304 domain-containing protein [Streptococcus didelphis]WMB29886.1 DUF1304 domain-containing protein [Streptococcus didelphis]
MSILTLVLATMVAIEQLYIMYLETFATQSSITQKVFRLDPEQVMDKTIVNLLKNQGIYNGLIAVFELYGLFVSQSSEIVTVFLFFVVAAAIYSSLTVDKKIIFKQGGIAILTLLSLWL